MKQKTGEDYEGEILDIDEVEGTDIKINPDYYIHLAIVNAQKALVNEDFNTGYRVFFSVVKNMESLAKASNMLPLDYEEKILEYKRTEEYANEDNTPVKMFLISNKKMELILENLFQSKTVLTKLKI